MALFGFISLSVLVAGLCAAFAIFISVRHIYNHLSHYVVPEFQLHIVRILAMVPIYSLTSWSALVAQEERTILVLDLARDSYEAYVIYNFVILLINYGGGHLRLCRYLEDQPRMPHPFPGNIWLPPLKLGPGFLAGIRVAVLQFVFVKPVNSVLNLYISFQPETTVRSLAQAAIVIINNLSVSAALYGLVLFYHAAEELLRPYRPFEKFIAVKAVIFFSFWQGFALLIARQLGVIHDAVGFSSDDQSIAIQDVLICAEMSIAAVAHVFIFTWSEYVGPDLSLPTTNKHPLLHVVDFRDVLSDVKDRFYGGVGYENELVEGAPINPGNVLGDSPSASSSLSYARGRATSRSRIPAAPVGALPRRALSADPRDLHQIQRTHRQPSISSDLSAVPWALRYPNPSQSTTPSDSIKRMQNPTEILER